jgi:hypothetical protein
VLLWHLCLIFLVFVVIIDDGVQENTVDSCGHGHCVRVLVSVMNGILRALTPRAIPVYRSPVGGRNCCGRGGARPVAGMHAKLFIEFSSPETVL